MPRALSSVSGLAPLPGPRASLLPPPHPPGASLAVTLAARFFCPAKALATGSRERTWRAGGSRLEVAPRGGTEPRVSARRESKFSVPAPGAGSADFLLVVGDAGRGKGQPIGAAGLPFPVTWRQACRASHASPDSVNREKEVTIRQPRPCLLASVR